MRRTRDIVTLTAAFVLHAGLAAWLLRPAAQKQRGPQVLEVEVKPPSPPAPPLTPPEPARPRPEPPRRAVPKRRTAATPPPFTPPPNADPPKDPPKPVFGVTMDSGSDRGSSLAVPVGNTLMRDPGTSVKAAGPVAPLAQAPPAERPYKPVSALYIKTMPEIDSEECGRGVPFPQQARELGIQGDVVLRVELDEKGQVQSAKVLSGLGYGLDQAAIHALKFKCKFTPAIASDGSPVSYVIPAYTFHFELPR
jgi:protein TonB